MVDEGPAGPPYADPRQELASIAGLSVRTWSGKRKPGPWASHAVRGRGP